jgi:hypothetical protein
LTRNTVLLIGIGLAAVGCTNPNQSNAFFPLDGTKKVTYEVKTGFLKFVEAFTFEPLKTSPATGRFVVKSGLGNSVFFWNNRVLYTIQTPRTFFDEPVPILSILDGTLSTDSAILKAGRKLPVRISTESKAETLQIANRSVPVRYSIVTLKSNTDEVQLKTWFQSGIGIVRQEQRMNGELDYSLQLLSED